MAQLPFLDQQRFIDDIFGDRPELAMYGAIPGGMTPFQQGLFRNQGSDMMKRFYGAAGRDLMEGMMPSQSPQGFFGNMDFQKEIFDMPRFSRGAATNIHNPRTKFLYGF